MPKMLPEDFSETTQVLDFEAEYDDATKQINPDPLFLPDEEMDEDEGDVSTMLIPFDSIIAANRQCGNQDMDSHADELQPSPLPADNRESGNDGERPMRVRIWNTPISY